MKVLFSGRFDSGHLGHWTTILRLWHEFGSVLVVVLDFPGRDEPAEYICQIFNDLAKQTGLDLSIKATANSTHFGKITKKEWDEYECSVYASGNMEVLKHMDSLGVKIYYTDRAWDFSAHNYKRGKT